MEKLAKSANTLDKFLKVISNIFCTCGIVGLVLLVIAFIFPTSSMVDYDSFTLEFGSVIFHLNDECAHNVTLMRAQFVFAAVSLLCAVLSVYFIVRTLRGILAPMKDGTPFTGSVSSGLKKLAIVILISGASFSLTNMICEIMMYKLYDFSTLFINENITSVGLELEMDLTFVVISAVLFLLSHIFRYGEQLQQQADETL